ncbi:M20/M25/M40 family metallo-hydrolase [Cellulomonas sp. C5510]|uniref:M20/M25/M40 family metallo-hydrolase n=1 Tax=Cellulomonas sp. C5510 TaxID=2871170 RepID=UPI001C97D187|nr:M20/M25/M40 family metallo-hydrolase [Cellulomonas sp. C5510]QZN84526.1 M20/M25/M40 family metallo-hydrolase [Cellulomonas sp. C5510]
MTRAGAWTCRCAQRRGGDQEEVVRRLSDLVRLDTTNPPGNESLVTEYVAGELAAVGVPAVVLESAPGRANLVARLRGAGTGPTVMLLAHADVVGASPVGWTHPPFSGRVVDGEVWGRGSLDMKAHLASWLTLVAGLAEHRVPLGGDVVLVVTADEEAGSRLGAHWLVENHPDLVRADLAFCEGGGQRIPTAAGPLYTVQVAEKGTATVRVTASGTGGHASVPRADNAVLALADALHRLGRSRTRSLPTETTDLMLEVLAASTADPHVRSALLDVRRQPTFEAAAGLPLVPFLRDFVVAGLHNTAVPTRLSASDRVNVAPAEASAVLDCRLVPGQRPEDWVEHLRAVLGGQVRVDLIRGRAGREGPPADELLTVVDEVLDEVDPGGRALPYLSSAATDARAFPGIPVLGFFPSASDRDLMRLIHGVDERALISDVMHGHRITGGLVMRLCGAQIDHAEECHAGVQ